MIQFAHPYVLLAVIPVLAASIYLLLRKKRNQILRSIILIIAIVAAASPFVIEQVLTDNVLFLVDRSASVGMTAEDADVLAEIRRIMDDSPGKRFGLIEFAKTAVVSAPLGMSTTALGMTALDDSETNLRAAAELALAIAPVDESNQFVLLSDGHFSDSVEDATGLFQLSGIPVSILPIGARVLADVSISSLAAPSVVPIDRPFTLDIEITAETAGPVRVALYRENELVAMQELDVPAGATTLSLTDQMTRLGSSVYQAIVKRADDPVSINDDLSVLISSTELPQILLVDPAGTSSIPVLLGSLGLTFTPTTTIPSLEVLSEYRQLILVGEKLGDYTLTEVEIIDHFARQLGGGILLINGEFETRGFIRGGIEQLLPVTFDIPEKTEKASLAIVYLLDRSASMRSRVDGVEKIDVLKEAAVASINLLDEEASVGIIAFDSIYEWILDIGPIEFAQIIDALQPMDAIGGTEIYPPLVDALDHLDAVEARSKHVLLVSDGKESDVVFDYPSLVARLAASSDITLSAIAVGSSPNTTLLGTLVRAGGGTLYLADDFSTLPQISIRATQRLSRERFVTEETPVMGRLLSSMPADSVPPIDGYVVSYPKESTETLLWGADDPILATWRVGLGSVSVLNTDLSGAWTQNWFEWPEFPGLFEKILATIESDTSATLGLSASVEFDGSTTSILVDAQEDSGAYANFLDVTAEILPLGTQVELSQVSSGLYHASIPTPGKGGYTIQITDQTRDRTLSVPLSVPYSAEYTSMGQHETELAWIAEMTGGALLGATVSLPATVERPASIIQPLYQWLILIALALFLLELVVRKWPSRRRTKETA